MAAIYRVKNWPILYEKAQAAKCKYTRWVPIPNKLDGAGYGAVAMHEKKCELFTGWILIVEVASLMRPVRGTLWKDGRALTPKDLWLKTRFPEEIFTLAFDVFVGPEIDWMEIIDEAEVGVDWEAAGRALPPL